MNHNHVVKDLPISTNRFYVRAAFVTYGLWFIAYEAVGQFVARLPTIDLTTVYDERIPIIPAFVWVYQLCYVFPFLPLFVIKDWHRFNRWIVGIVLANLIAFVVYLLYPVAVPRPVLGDTFSEQALAFIYRIDFNPAVTALPSLHVAFSWMVYFVCRGQRLNRLGDLLVMAVAVLISLSTLFVKQHFIVDVIAGFVLANAAWFGASFLYPRIVNATADAPAALVQFSRRLILASPVVVVLFTIVIWLGPK